MASDLQGRAGRNRPNEVKLLRKITLMLVLSSLIGYKLSQSESLVCAPSQTFLSIGLNLRIK